ncbi:MAG: hypothetical protein SOR75_06055, partial [Synergistes jonesii]|uniref:hypothetical protein n=1 Tax=Synergistes jonesii TaxID=2754 RepID=UPI002A763A96
LNQPGVMLNAGKTACFQGYFYHLRQSINNLNPIFPDLYLRKIKGLNVINIIKFHAPCRARARYPSAKTVS